jgi:hypothetical protein
LPIWNEETISGTTDARRAELVELEKRELAELTTASVKRALPVIALASKVRAGTVVRLTDENASPDDAIWGKWFENPSASFSPPGSKVVHAIDTMSLLVHGADYLDGLAKRMLDSCGAE